MKECDIMKKELLNLLKEDLRLYDLSPDGAHDKNHICDVIRNAYSIASKMKLNTDLAVFSALYHDIGLLLGNREEHDINGFNFICKNQKLKQYFNAYEIDIIAHAVKEHRASYKGNYFSIYSIIVSDSDRSLSIETMIRRSYLYNKDKSNDVYNTVYSYLKKKYGYGGVELHLDFSKEILEESRKILSNEKEFKFHYDRIIIKIA